ncbi:MAG: DUF4384 domain-containing protein [Deltaproteobacteria bacterium]|nr:DUF4384 domain-containing protein [Deltaproteobacteria bacterium]
MTELFQMRTEGSAKEHPGAWALECHHAGEGESALRKSIEDHLKTCLSCREKIEALKEASANFEGRMNRAGFLAAVQQGMKEAEEPLSRRRIWPWFAVVGTALAAMLLWMVLQPQLGVLGGEGADGIRIKGDSTLKLGFFIEHDGKTELVDPTKVLHPGERIQFALTGPRGGFVHLVGVDEAGLVSVYYPRSDQGQEEFPGGVGRPVPGAVLLDGTLGRERIFVLVCEQAMKAAQIKSRVEGLRPDVRGLLDEDMLDFDCAQTSLVLHKERRP